MRRLAASKVLQRQGVVYCLIFVIVIAVLCGTASLACANTQVQESLSCEQLLPYEYYEFADIERIAVSSNGTIAVVEKRQESYFLKIIGSAISRELSLPRKPSYIDIFDDYVIGDFDDTVQDNARLLAIYGIYEDELALTEISAELYDIAIDNIDNVLYTLSRQEINKYKLESKENNTLPLDSSNIIKDLVGSYSFPNNFQILPNHIVAENSIAYLHSSKPSDGIYKYQNNVVSEVLDHSADGLLNLCIHTEGLLFISNNGVYLNGFDNQIIEVAGTLNKDSDILEISDIAVSDNLIYIADNLTKSIKMFKKNGFVKMYGSYGKGDYRLNNPLSMSVDVNSIIIADNENNRIIEYSITANDEIEKSNEIDFVDPQIVVSDKVEMYIVKNQQLYHYQNGVQSQEAFSFEDKIISVVWTKNGLFVATKYKIWQKQSEEFIEYLAFDEPIKHLAKGLFGNGLFIHYGEKVVSYYGNGLFAEAELDLFEYQIEEVSAMAVDYCANLYIAVQNKIYRFDRDSKSYRKTYVDDVLGVSNIVDLKIDANGKVYILSEHQLANIKGLAVATEDSTNREITPMSEHPIKIAKGKSWLQRQPDNYDDVIYLSDYEYLMVLNSSIIEQQVEYLFVEYKNELFYIEKKNCEIINSLEVEDLFVRSLFGSVNIYKYPSSTSDILYESLTYSDIIEVKAFTAYVDDKDIWGWYLVEFDNQVGYVQISSVVDAYSDYEHIVRYYAKAKSAYFGAAVPIYSMPDIESPIICKVSDGTLIELAHELDYEKLFIKVNYEGKVGYMLTESLMKKGLTDGQILAIVLSVFTVVASIVLLLMFRIFKNKKG